MILQKPGDFPKKAESVDGWLEEIGLVQLPLCALSRLSARAVPLCAPILLRQMLLPVRSTSAI